MGVNDIDAIYFTHVHPDHCTGLTALLNYWKSGSRQKPLIIYCQPAQQPVLMQLAALANWPQADPGFTINWQECREAWTWQDWQIRTAATQHELSNRAIRITIAGQTLFYSGDGRPTADSIALMAGAGLAFQECASVAALDDDASHGDFPSCLMLFQNAAAPGAGALSLRGRRPVGAEASLSAVAGIIRVAGWGPLYAAATRIRRRGACPMSPRKPSVTAQDVARLAGVSRAVVSRALSSNGSISPDARARVLRAAEELGYQVNFLAQGLNRQRSHLIGVIVSRISDPFRSALLDALLNEIQRQGFQALVSEIHSEQDLAHTLRRFTQFRVSGVIVTSGQPPEALVNECVQQHIPVVGINRQPTIPGVDYVCSDNIAGAELAADQLLRSGCRRFGWLNHSPSTWAGRMRGEAFSRALQARGVDVERNLAILACPEEGYTGGFQAAALADEALEGIFCANAQIACGFLDGMRQRGKQAPEDYQLIGFDNTPPTAQYSYQLTTLHQDVAAISRQALARLQERTVDPLQPSRTTWVEVTLIHRRTSPFII